jgi:hypothetical protein
MRDLKADLELCNKATPGLQEVLTEWDGKVVLGFGVPGEHVHQLSEVEYSLITQATEGWSHAIERAIKAETLVLELREALNKIAYPVRYLQTEADKKNLSLDGRVATELANSSHWLKSIAKEVLGDE